MDNIIRVLDMVELVRAAKSGNKWALYTLLNNRGLITRHVDRMTQQEMAYVSKIMVRPFDLSDGKKNTVEKLGLLG